MGAVPDPEVFPATCHLSRLLLLESSISSLELSWEDKVRGRGISVRLSFATGRGAAGVSGGLKGCFLCWLPPY